MNKLNYLISILPKEIKFKALILLGLIIVCMFLEVMTIGLVLPLTASIVSGNNISEGIFLADTIRDLSQNLEIESLLIIIVVLFFIFYTAKIIFNLILVYFEMNFSFKIYEYLSRNMLKIYLGKEWDFFTRTNVALLMRDVAGESAFIRTSIVAPIVSTVKESLILLGIVSFLIYLQPKTTIIICVSLILLILLIKLSTFKMVKKLGLRRQETSGYLNKNLIEVFNLIKEIKILNKENYFYKDFKFINKDYIKVNKAFSIIIQLPRQLIELLGIFGIAAFLIIYSHYNDSLIDIIPYIGVFFAAAYKMLPGITKVLTASQSLDFGANALDLYVREFNLEKLKKNLIKSENSNKFDNFEKIEIENLNFRYKINEKFVLKNFNLSIKRNDIIGIKGQSGEGKSTLINILMGLFEPTDGKIYADKVNIFEDISSWQKKISLVQQDIYLIDESVKKNIALGVEEKDIDEIKLKNAIKNAQLDDFVNNLENGVESIVGDRGLQISGGQKQRIGIARALYADTEILILDEATSSLDETTEENIMKFIKEIIGNKTIIIISHRDAALKNCSKIIKLEKN